MRVSTFDQNLDMQEDALKRDGCDKIFSDKVSGASSKIERPGLSSALDYMREGDTLVIYKLDRLGRTLKGLIQMINELGDKKMGLKSLSESIDTTTANGKLIFHIFGAISEFERDIIRERTRAGLGAARARGRVGGRPTKMTPEKIKMAKQLHADTSLEIKDIVKTLGVSRAVFYRMLKSALI